MLTTVTTTALMLRRAV